MDPARGEGLPWQRPLGHLSSRRFRTLTFCVPVIPLSASLSSKYMSMCFMVHYSCLKIAFPSLERVSVSFLFFALFCLSCRKVLMLGLRCCGLQAELRALCTQCQELEDVSGHRQLLLRELQTKQQRILHWRQRVVRSRAWKRARAEGWGLVIKHWAGRGPRGKQDPCKGMASAWEVRRTCS